jgi:hypothetical protein
MPSVISFSSIDRRVYGTTNSNCGERLNSSRWASVHQKSDTSVAPRYGSPSILANIPVGIEPKGLGSEVSGPHFSLLARASAPGRLSLPVRQLGGRRRARNRSSRNWRSGRRGPHRDPHCGFGLGARAAWMTHRPLVNGRPSRATQVHPYGASSGVVTGSPTRRWSPSLPDLSWRRETGAR